METLKSEITNKELLQISQSLTILSQKETDAWYQISRNLKKVAGPVKELTELKNDILQKLAKKDEKGEVIFTDETKTRVDLGDNEAEADKLWNDLQNETREIEFFKFPYSKIGNLKISPMVMQPLIDVIITE